jgi:hypothetical protein
MQINKSLVCKKKTTTKANTLLFSFNITIFKINNAEKKEINLNVNSSRKKETKKERHVPFKECTLSCIL